jgi:hypothetical protein
MKVLAPQADDEDACEIRSSLPGPRRGWGGREIGKLLHKRRGRVGHWRGFTNFGRAYTEVATGGERVAAQTIGFGGKFGIVKEHRSSGFVSPNSPPFTTVITASAIASPT